MAELETESQGIEIQVHNSAQGEEQLGRVVTSINGMFEKLSPVSPHRCIYRVHEALRRLKPEAYTPQVVSIGLLYRGNPSLQAMEEHKLRYLHNFLTRFNVSLKDCVKVAREMETRARDCYADKTSNLTSDEFVNMLLVDAAFIISFLWGAQGYYSSQLHLQVTNDMMLLENQLPFFVIERVFTEFVSHMVDRSLFELTFNLFKKVYIEADQKPKQIPSPICKHFTDFLRICLMPSQNTQDPDPPTSCSYESIPNAEKLHDAGVTFKLNPSNCLVDIKFNARTGELQIPFIKLDDNAESFYRNVMAFEMYHQDIPKTYVTDYMEFLDDLINTPNDVDLLVHKKIIYNRLGDNQAVATLFNNLLKQIVVTSPGKNFRKLCKDLNAFYELPTNKWKVLLKRDYFSTPWRTVSTIAAVILLLLTLLSTIWAMK